MLLRMKDHLYNKDSSQEHNRVKRERRHFMLSALHQVHQVHRITSTNDSTYPIMHNVILTLLDVEVDLSNNDVHALSIRSLCVTTFTFCARQLNIKRMHSAFKIC